jgi:hypothetical protein
LGSFLPFGKFSSFSSKQEGTILVFANDWGPYKSIASISFRL